MNRHIEDGGALTRDEARENLEVIDAWEAPDHDPETGVRSENDGIDVIESDGSLSGIFRMT